MKTTGEVNTRTETWQDYNATIHLSKEEAKELIKETIRSHYKYDPDHQFAKEEIENAYKKMGDKSKFTLGITARLQVEKPEDIRMDSYEHWFRVSID